LTRPPDEAILAFRKYIRVAQAHPEYRAGMQEALKALHMLEARMQLPQVTAPPAAP
jgi:hypothetical protein